MSIIYILCCKIKYKTVTKGIHQKLSEDSEGILQKTENTVDCILGLLAMTTATHDGGVVFTVWPYVALVQQLLLKLLVADMASENHFDVTADWLQHWSWSLHQGL